MDMRKNNGRSKSPEEHFKKLSLSIDPILFDRLIKYSEKEERAYSWVVRKALEQYLDKNE